ncbi:MAG: 4-oxalomesaconate tautomerase [Treponema sp.]|nr:4-oxalomesaconate tautomerase [Treponema sp.]
MNSQKAIPCCFMRGGTSKGPFFLAPDLPDDIELRDKVLLAAMGSPDARQIDGIGGAHPLTSKVGIVSKSAAPGVDLEFLFAQLQPNGDKVDTTPNCGNMLAAVVPFALERALVKATGDTSTFRVLTLNTDMLCDITVQTPNGVIEYAGDTAIDGAPGTAAPVKINFLDTAGSVCSGLLPTGKVRDTICGIDVTCIDNGMPMVMIDARSMGITGYETAADLNQNASLKKSLEELRLAASVEMGLGDTKEKSYPKMCMISESQHGGTVNTRCFIPHVCHEAVGVLGAVTIATACVMPGSVCDGIARVGKGLSQNISVEHPSGEFTIEMTLDDSGNVTAASLLRTARLLMQGEVMVPRSLFQ